MIQSMIKVRLGVALMCVHRHAILGLLTMVLTNKRTLYYTIAIFVHSQPDQDTKYCCFVSTISQHAKIQSIEFRFKLSASFC